MKNCLLARFGFFFSFSASNTLLIYSSTTTTVKRYKELEGEPTDGMNVDCQLVAFTEFSMVVFLTDFK